MQYSKHHTCITDVAQLVESNPIFIVGWGVEIQ